MNTSELNCQLSGMGMSRVRKSPLEDFLPRGCSEEPNPGRHSPPLLAPLPAWLVCCRDSLVFQSPLCSRRARDQPSRPRFPLWQDPPPLWQGCSEQLQQGQGELFCRTGGLKLSLFPLSLSVLVTLTICLVSGFCSLGNF